MTASDTPTPDDRVEKEIYVSAPADLVWELVSRPGWWINDGDVDDHPRLSQDGDVTTLSHPAWGDFLLRTVTTERPRHIAFRWLSAPSGDAEHPADPADLTDDASTLVELWIDDKPGGVTLRVAESGFTSLTDDEDAAAQQRADNEEGWANELRAARDFVIAHRD